MFDFSKFKIYSSGNYQFELYSTFDGKCGVFRTSFYDIAVSTISNWLARGINFQVNVISLVETFDISCKQLSFF